MFAVYLITNSINGLRYVGQTSQGVQTRWREHRCIRSTKHSLLSTAIRTHGVKNFTVDTLVIVKTKQEVDLYERGLILALGTRSPNGYNVSAGGEGSSGYKHTPGTRRRMSTAHTGKIVSLGTKQRMSLAATGRILSEEARKKISQSKSGRKLSKRARHNMSLAHLGKSLSLKHREAIGKSSLGHRRGVGRAHSLEHRRNISKAMTGRTLSLEHRRNLSKQKIENNRRTKVIQ